MTSVYNVVNNSRRTVVSTQSDLLCQLKYLQFYREPAWWRCTGSWVELLSNSSLSLFNLSLVFRLGVDFVLLLSQEEQEEEPPTKIYQKEVYYGLEIWHQDLTHKIKTRWSAMDGQSPSLGWSPTIPRIVTHHPKSTRIKSITDLKFGTQT